MNVTYKKCKLEKDLTSMFGKLWVGQDLFAKLEPISVLLVFVASLKDKNQEIIFKSDLM